MLQNEEQHVEGLTSERPLPDQRVPLDFPDQMDIASVLRLWIPRMVGPICIAVFFVHLTVIQRYAVNIPSGDDWAMLQPGRPSLSVRWLFAQHNEHRIPLNKVFVWLQFQLNGWNYPIHLLLDFLIYGLILTVIWLFARKFAPQVPSWIVLSFILFLLSPINWFNHFMADQSAAHFYLLFLFLGSYFLFDTSQRWLYLILGSAASALTIYSFGAGFISISVLLVTFSVFKGLRLYSAGTNERRRELLQLLLSVGLILGGLLTWTLGFVKPPYHPPLTSPRTRIFWEVFLNLISWGFAIERISSGWGAFCLLIVLTPILGQVWKSKARLSGAQWAIFAIVLAILGNLAAISTGRAAFGILAAAKADRYVEIIMPLVPLSAINWALFLQGHEKEKRIVLAGLWIFCALTFSQTWDFAVYRKESILRKAGVECVKGYYEGRRPALCPTIVPETHPLALLLENGKTLNASFYQDIRAEVERKRKTGIEAVEPKYIGWHDYADCQHITGWAYNRAEPEAMLDVAILDGDGDSLAGIAHAYKFRPDVMAGGFGTGLYGFDYPTPLALKDGRVHSIRVRVANTSFDLSGTPKSLVCTPP
jgi:hypothetical protein